MNVEMWRERIMYEKVQGIGLINIKIKVVVIEDI